MRYLSVHSDVELAAMASDDETMVLRSHMTEITLGHHAYRHRTKLGFLLRQTEKSPASTLVEMGYRSQLDLTPFGILRSTLFEIHGIIDPYEDDSAMSELDKSLTRLTAATEIVIYYSVNLAPPHVVVYRDY